MKKTLLVISFAVLLFTSARIAVAATIEQSLVIEGRSIPENSISVSTVASGVVGKPFILDATKSQDDGVIKSFLWKQVEGPVVVITKVSALQSSVVPMSAGTYVFDLIVTDATGLSSAIQRIQLAATSEVQVVKAVPPPSPLPPGDPDFNLLRISPTPPVALDINHDGVVDIITKTAPPPSPSALKGSDSGVGELSDKIESGRKVGEGTKLQSATTSGTDIRDEDDDGDNMPTKDEDVGTSMMVSKVIVRGWDVKKKEEFLSEQKTFAEVRSQQDLENFASGVLLKVETIEEVQFNPKEISVSYQAAGKLLWLFPMNYTERLVVSEKKGELSFKAKKPWYGFLIHSKDDPDETAEAAKVKHKETINMDSISWGVSNHASLLNTISNVLKTKHDTAKNSISNVR